MGARPARPSDSVTGSPSACGSDPSAAGRGRVAGNWKPVANPLSAQAIGKEWLKPDGSASGGPGGRWRGQVWRCSETFCAAGTGDVPAPWLGVGIVRRTSRNAGVSTTQDGPKPAVVSAMAGCCRRRCGPHRPASHQARRMPQGETQPRAKAVTSAVMCSPFRARVAMGARYGAEAVIRKLNLRQAAAGALRVAVAQHEAEANRSLKLVSKWLFRYERLAFGTPSYG
jgi:hypothetical protein